MRFTFRCQVRWDDMDAFGHVNNVTFFAYMQEARTGMLFATVVAFLVELALGHSGAPFYWLAAIGGFTYLGAYLYGTRH